MPIPSDSDVKVIKVPAHFMAAVAFSGAPPSEAKVEDKRRLVAGQLSSRGLRVKSGSDTLVYGYHDPFMTPDLLRRNEVGIMVHM